MSIGPSEATPNYENLWKSYSGWLSESKSLYGQESSRAKVKAASSGIIGATPSAMQTKFESDFGTALKGIREGVVGSTLKKFAKGSVQEGYGYGKGEYVKYSRDVEGRRISAKVTGTEAYGWTPQTYESLTERFREAYGADPRSWELFLFNKFGGPKKTELTKQEQAIFKTEPKNLLAGIESQTKSPWV